MKLDDGFGAERLSLDVTPLLDVVFILVLFFAVTTSFISPRELDALKGNVVSLTEDKRSLDREVRRVSAALDARAAELASLNERHAELRLEHAQMLEAKRAEVAALESRLDAQRADSEKMRWMMAALEEDKAGIEKTLADSTRTNASLREQLEQAYRDYRGVQIALEDLRDEHRAQAQALASTHTDLTGARARAASLEDRVAGLSATVQETSERERLLQALIRQKAAEAAAAADAAAARLGDAEQRLDAAQQRGEALARRVAALQADLGTRADDERLLRALLAEKAEQAADLDRRLSSAEGERAALAGELAGLRALSAEQADEVRSLRARVARMDTELAKFREIADLDREQIERIVRAQERLRAGLGEYLEDNRIGITRDRERLTLQLSDRILFASGSASIRADGLEVLRRLGELLRERLDVLEVQVGGHTDNVPLSGARGGLLSDNWGLSAARAVSVVDFLQDEVGLDPDRLSAVGYGEHRPVAPNDTPQGRARNRRIEIVLLPR